MQGNTSIAQMQADKFGNFTFALDPGKIDPTKQVTIKLTEVDLTVNPRLPAPSPATDSVTVDPIPSYLEGYAYNAQGVKVPFAKVRIRLQLTDAVYYETYADKDAFYSVSPRNLPIFPFYIEVVPSNQIPVITTTTGGMGGSTGSLPGTGSGTSGSGTGALPGTGTSGTASNASRITIPVYSQQNKEYHDTQVIDIMSGTKNGTKVDPVAVGDTSTAVFGNSKTGQQGTATTAQDEFDGTRTQRFVKAMIFVVLLVFIGTVSVILIRKRDPIQS